MSAFTYYFCFLWLYFIEVDGKYLYGCYVGKSIYVPVWFYTFINVCLGFRNEVKRLLKYWEKC